jgi:hypothetical protein
LKFVVAFHNVCLASECIFIASYPPLFKSEWQEQSRNPSRHHDQTSVATCQQ